jgi:hypothetical protein
MAAISSANAVMGITKPHDRHHRDGGRAVVQRVKADSTRAQGRAGLIAAGRRAHHRAQVDRHRHARGDRSEQGKSPPRCRNPNCHA